MENILISTECVADLPPEIIEKYEIGIVYYTVKTDMGEFRDTDEITALNAMEYMMGGHKKALSVIPSEAEYETFFRENIGKYERILHISISSDVSDACIHAQQAAALVAPEKIRVVDSRHLSSGQGLMVIAAAKARQQGKTWGELGDYVEGLISRVSTSFLAYNADYLYYNDKVSEKVMNLCRRFHLHPVLTMADGKLTLKRVYIGAYERASRKYIKKAIGNGRGIKKDIGFITYAGCTHKALERIYTDVQKSVGFESLYEQQASASISCNCGPDTFGVLYIKND